MLKVRRSRIYTLWFRHYSRSQFRKYFTSVLTFGSEHLKEMNHKYPIIFYINHAYWWDGFWSQLCTEEYFNQNLYIIIEYKQLVRYQFFSRLGAFSIVRENPREAIKTIHYAVEQLGRPSEKQNALWIFPQGEIKHIDERPLGFFGGTAKIVEGLLKKDTPVYLSSMVTRVDYLDEQKPEMFLSFKAPELIEPGNFSSVKALTADMEEKTEAHLDELTGKIMRRNFENGHILVEGELSVNKKLDQVKTLLGLHPKS
jgi:chlorobactene lauroyltransferase